VKKGQYDENQSDYEQSVNPVSGLREVGADVPAKKAEKPENNQYYDNGPKHVISPFK
jgi:hypothetical protein